jgi:SET domain-containing protein
MKLIIKESRIGGKGSFAPEDIKKGTKILTFQGETIDLKELLRRIKSGEEKADNPLQIDDTKYLDLNDNSIYINHSCNPNTAFRGVADLVAIKDIEKEEEITFDYSSTVGKNVDWTMECNCGAYNCRKKIGNVLSIPREDLEKYYEEGGLQDYIRKQLNLL